MELLIALKTMICCSQKMKISTINDHITDESKSNCSKHTNNSNNNNSNFKTINNNFNKCSTSMEASKLKPKLKKKPSSTSIWRKKTLAVTREPVLIRVKELEANNVEEYIYNQSETNMSYFFDHIVTQD